MLPIAKPCIGNEEIRAVEDVISSGWIMQGPKVKEFEDAFADYAGSKYACAVSSGTAALHLALLSVGVKPGEAVITVSHSFIATANSIRYCGAEPVFIDIELDDFNMSVGHLDKILNEEHELKGDRIYYKGRRVACIMPVHQMGIPCDLKGILSLARKYNIPIVEDAACAIGSEIKVATRWEKIGRPHGDIACFSFHPRKVITTGEGGMMVTSNPAFDEKCRALRNHGMNIAGSARHTGNSVVFEGYSAVGYNYRLTDMQAAIGLEQLKKLPTILSDYKRIAARYSAELESVVWLKLLKEPSDSRFNWQSYPIRLLKEAPIKRDALMQRMLDNGISTRRGITNAHQEKAYRCDMKLENSEIGRDSVVLLPIFYGMTDKEMDKIIEVIINV